jgi:hypothetical protein
MTRRLVLEINRARLQKYRDELDEAHRKGIYRLVTPESVVALVVEVVEIREEGDDDPRPG